MTITPMPIEFERKFLLTPEAVPELLAASKSVQALVQGYFMEDDERCVRIRGVSDLGFDPTARTWTPKSFSYLLTFKSKTGEVGKAHEIEMPIAEAEAKALMALCRTKVLKRRHVIEVDGLTWEIDQFQDHNAGLVLAEVELTDEAQSSALSARLPSWVAREVTGHPHYFNTWLAAHCVPLG